jgi:hypothetical protein
MRLERKDLHRAYLLRCWQEEASDPNGTPGWRFSVEEVLHERQRRGFDSLEALVAFLRDELADGEGDPYARP